MGDIKPVSNQLKAHKKANAPGKDQEFWVVGGYKIVVKRLADAKELCDDLCALMQARAELELQYAKKLEHWSSNWREKVRKGHEYGCMPSIWGVMLEEGERTSRKHQQVVYGIHQIAKDLYKWKKNKYQKLSVGTGYKNVEEMKEGFKAAQKKHRAAMEKLSEIRKKCLAVKEDFSSCSRSLEKAIATNADPSTLRKLEEKIAIVKQTGLKYMAAYQDMLDTVNKGKPEYNLRMRTQQSIADKEELLRMALFREKITRYLSRIDPDQRGNTDDLIRIVNDKFKATDDVTFWSDKHGPGQDIDRVWPTKLPDHVFDSKWISSEDEKHIRITKKPSKKDKKKHVTGSESHTKTKSRIPGFLKRKKSKQRSHHDKVGKKVSDKLEMKESDKLEMKEIPKLEKTASAGKGRPTSAKPGHVATKESIATVDSVCFSEFDDLDEYGDDDGTPVEESTRPSAQDLSKKKEAIPAEPKEFRAITDFDREYDDELSFKEGDVLIILYSFSPYANYYKLKGSDGVEGYAETRHLEEVNPS